mgnify:CR=1 FL=1
MKDSYFGEMNLDYDKYLNCYYLDKDITLEWIPVPVSLSIVSDDKRSNKNQQEAFELIRKDFVSIWKRIVVFLTSTKKIITETQLRKEYRAKRKAGADTDSEAEELILSNFESQEKLIALKRTYFEKYKAVLPIKKLTRLTAAEREFKQVIVEEMKRRRAQKEGKGGER